jgi:hypothetical protein
MEFLQLLYNATSVMCTVQSEITTWQSLDFANTFGPVKMADVPSKLCNSYQKIVMLYKVPDLWYTQRITFKTALTTFQFQENPSLCVNTAESFRRSSPSFGAINWNKIQYQYFSHFTDVIFHDAKVTTYAKFMTTAYNKNWVLIICPWLSVSSKCRVFKHEQIYFGKHDRNTVPWTKYNSLKWYGCWSINKQSKQSVNSSTVQCAHKTK